ncbi:hypothetical protein Sjap_023428 [Stephania japonica]|uniref:PPM-type phosphatase domain-containing protein n=1 Tax=Stephania japonica TaxID=461633 RepID=A0AAP0EBK1_9MAGN
MQVIMDRIDKWADKTGRSKTATIRAESPEQLADNEIDRVDDRTTEQTDGRVDRVDNRSTPESTASRTRSGDLEIGKWELSVVRVLGDWHMKGPKGSSCPLCAEPELKETMLIEDDEFFIIGCDRLWDVMSSQCAITIVRKELMLHNDPEKCSRELGGEALSRNTCDNLTVVTFLQIHHLG